MGEGLTVSGWSVDDDIVEAIELPDRRFALGVVWHPEEDETSEIIPALVERRVSFAPERRSRGGRDEHALGDRAGDREADGGDPAGGGRGDRRRGRPRQGGVPGLARRHPGGPGDG